MKGFLIRYKPMDSLKRVVFNHTLFGRLVYQNYRGKKFIYYNPGMLDDTLFLRVGNGIIFIPNIDYIDFELLSDYATVEIEECTRNVKIDKMFTGEQHWNNIAKEKGVELHVKRRKQKRT